MANESYPPPITSGGFQTTARQLLSEKSFIKADDLDDSFIEALYTANSTQYVKITKWALQKFLEACLREGGQFRPFFDKFAPFTGKFVVNKNFDNDPRKRPLQIARFFSQMTERPPQMFIQDTGYSYVPAGLGGLTGGWNTRDKYGNQVVHVFDSVPIPIEITFVSTSEDDTDEMMGFFSLAFGSFQKLLLGWYLAPEKAIKGAYWTVLLPYAHQLSAKTKQALHGDGEDQLWIITFSFEPIFENSTYLTYRSKPTADLRAGSFLVTLPEKITLHSTFPLQLRDIPYPIQVYSDNYKVAIVQEENAQYIVYPKRIGKFNLVVSKIGGTEENRPILYKQEVEVVLR